MTLTPDYTAKDFSTYRTALVNYLRTNYPDRWTDLTASNAGVVLLDLAAYVGFCGSWNLDKAAVELFPDTARTTSALLRHALARGYTPRGITPSSVLADVSTDAAVSGADLIIPAGTTVTASDGTPFEVVDQVTILAGDTVPHVAVGTQADTVPQGSVVSFIAGSVTVSFDDPSAFHTAALVPGLWIRPTSGLYSDWYRIASVSDDRTTITLASGYNIDFSQPFLIRTLNNDTSSSTIILNSQPSGGFPSNASATLASTVVSFTEVLPDTVLVGHWFRMNSVSNCEYNAFFKIAAIAADRRSITLATAYGPLDVGGFDSPSSGFAVESRSVSLVQGQSRTEQFQSDGTAAQTFVLTSTGISRGSIAVTDSVRVDGLGHPLVWTNLDSIGSAYGSAFTGVMLVPGPNDSYTLRFGDGNLGAIPSGTVTVTYLTTLGADVSVPVNAITTTLTGFQGSTPVTVAVVNSAGAATGGSAGEDTETLRLNLVSFGRTGGRAVTASDYADVLVTEYAKSAGALGVVLAASVDKTMMGRSYGTNEVFVQTWSSEGWKPSKSTSTKAYPYTRVAAPGLPLQNSVQTFIESRAAATDHPVILRGVVDSAIVELDLQVDASTDVVAAGLAAESTIAGLFNLPSVLNRSPLRVADVTSAVTGVKGYLGVLMRGMYLDYSDPSLPANVLDDTPVNLRKVYDLIPRTSASLVSPGDIIVNVWNTLVSVGVTVRGTYYQAFAGNTDISKDSIRQAVHDYFSSKRPGEEVSAVELQDILTQLSALDVTELGPVVKSYASNQPVSLSVESPVVVTFTGGLGAGASATATVTNGQVTAINLTSGGGLYQSAPTVTITGGGINASGATAVATITAGAVTSVTLLSGGSGYDLMGRFDNLPGGSRILLRAQTDASQNGVYVVTYDTINRLAIMTRSQDADSPLELHPGAYVLDSAVNAYWMYSGAQLNSANFATAPKPWTSGGFDAASNLVRAVTNPVVVFNRDARYPSNLLRSAVPGTVYLANSIDLL